MIHLAAVVITHKQFLPDTLGGWAAVFGGAAAGCAAMIGLLIKRQVQDVHVLVNGELHNKINKLAETTEQLDRVTKELASARASGTIEGTVKLTPTEEESK